MNDDEATARQVARALCPPADGIYDDESSMVRLEFRSGLLVRSFFRHAIDRHLRTKAEPFCYKPWGSYRLLP